MGSQIRFNYYQDDSADGKQVPTDPPMAMGVKHHWEFCGLPGQLAAKGGATD